MKQRRDVRNLVVNILGSIGYIAALFQWFWLAVVLLPSLLQTSLFKSLVVHSDSQIQTASPVVSSGSANPFVIFFALVAACLIISVTIYVLLAKFPRSVSKVGESITHTPVEVIVPVVIKHTHLTAKEKRALPISLILSFKILLIGLPLALLAFAAPLSLSVSFEIIVVIGAILFAWSFLSFALQAALAKFFNIDYTKVR